MAADSPDDYMELLNKTESGNKLPSDSNDWRRSQATPTILPDGSDAKMSSSSAKIISKAMLGEQDSEQLLRDAEAAAAPERKATAAAPNDRWNIVYFIVLLHGIAMLLPWNMIITAKDYYVEYKLNVPASNETDYRHNFLAYLGPIMQWPQVIFAGVNLAFHFGGSLTKRVVVSVSIMIVIFLLQLALAIADSSAWPFEFFLITAISVALLSVANGVYQNSMFGIGGMLPANYSNAIVIGNNVSGTLVTIIQIVAMWASPGMRSSGIYYFLAVLAVLLLAFNSYFLLPFNHFFAHYKREHRRHHDVVEPRCAPVSMRDMLTVFKVIKWQCFNIWFIFLVTLAMFPAIYAEVKTVNEGFMGAYFTMFTCFLLFSVFAMLGNLLAFIGTWPGPRLVVVPVVARVLFIPFFMLCNVPLKGTRAEWLPVLIKSDALYILGGIAFALSNGYYSSLVMMYAPRLVERKYAARAGQMAAFFLVLGVTCGVSLSRFFLGVLRGEL